MMVFAGFDKEIWCMDLGYVDKLAKDNNGVKYVLVRLDLFLGTVDAKGMNAKDSKKKIRAFLTIISKKLTHKTLGPHGKRFCSTVLKNMQS